MIGHAGELRRLRRIAKIVGCEVRVSRLVQRKGIALLVNLDQLDAAVEDYLTTGVPNDALRRQAVLVITLTGEDTSHGPQQATDRPGAPPQ